MHNIFDFTRNPLKRQGRVVFTLYLRDFKTNFGHFRLKYIWAIGEPVAYIMILCTLRLALGKGPISGIAFPLFFATGIIPFLIFSNTIGQCSSIIESNLPLMTYRVVKPIHPIIAKSLVALTKYTLAGFCIIGLLICLGFTFTLNSILHLTLTMLLLYFLTLGTGIFIAVICSFSRDLKKFINILTRPLFFISGIFFAAETIPAKFRTILLFNPMMHVIELTREYVFSDFTNPHGNLSYLSLTTLTVLFIGLFVYHYKKRKIVTSGIIR